MSGSPASGGRDGAAPTTPRRMRGENRIAVFPPDDAFMHRIAVPGTDAGDVDNLVRRDSDVGNRDVRGLDAGGLHCVVSHDTSDSE